MKKLIFILLCCVAMGCEIENINYLNPIMITDEPQSVLTDSAILGGKVLGEGGKDVTEYGIVWSTSIPPTINDNKIIEGERIGTFSRIYQIFEPNTTYYYSAYGISEVGVGYGAIYEFITNAEAPCEPARDNLINLGTNIIGQDQLDIDSVTFTTNTSFNEGNIRFTASSSSSTVSININFNELNGDLPRTGQYTSVLRFENSDPKSDGKAILNVENFDFNGPGGATANPDITFFVINENQKITITFCDTPVGDNYTLNGKFSYQQ